MRSKNWLIMEEGKYNLLGGGGEEYGIRTNPRVDSSRLLIPTDQSPNPIAAGEALSVIGWWEVQVFNHANTVQFLLLPVK